MRKQLRSIFKKNPDRTLYQSEFVTNMNLQLSGFWRIGAFISIFAWLEFAFKTDKLIHPEYEELFFFRIGLTVLAVFIFVFSFVPQLKQQGALFLKILIAYVIVSSSLFVGRLAADTNYVSGLQISVMIPIATPVRFRLILILMFSSMAIFLTSVLIYKPELGTDVARFSMNNLVISYVLAIAFTYLLDKIRFESFLKTKKIELKNIEIEAQIKRINELKTQQDGDYFLTSQ